MPARRFTMSKRCTPGSADGFSLVELLVGLGVLGVIAGATLTVALSGRAMFETDRSRTAVNQNLRAGIDLLGVDIRQAGERLPGDAPAVQLIDGGSGAPDRLLLRRNQLDEVLPLCKDIKAGTNADSVFIGRKKGGPKDVPPGCAPVPDEDGDGWPDNLGTWRDYRLANGGIVTAYIYNPVTGEGEFFVFDAEDSSTFHLHKSNSEKWEKEFLVEQNPRIYALEQREFRVRDDMLQAVINDNFDNPLNLVTKIADFQVQAHMRDGSVLDSLAGGAGWVELEAVSVTLDGADALRNRTMERSVRARFFPRNVLSN